MALAQSFNVDASGNEVISGSVSVSNFPGTQAVSGTVTANIGTTNGLALDSTVAKDSSLSTLNTSVNSLLKPASTLAAVTAITNTVTIKADTAGNQANALKVDGSAVTQPVSIAGTVSVTSAVSTTGTITSVAGAAVSTTLLVSNSARKGIIIFNDSTSILKVALAATASGTSFSFSLQPNSTYENGTLYTGIITGIWASAAGSARVTELT